MPSQPSYGPASRSHLRETAARFDGTMAPSDHESLQPDGRVDARHARLLRLTTLRAARALQERHSLARRLHDDIGQMMFVVRMEIDQLSQLHATGASRDAVDRSIGALRASTDDVLRLVRNLCVDLRDTPSGLLDVPTVVDPIVRGLARRGRLTGRVLTTGGRVQLEGRRALLVAGICREAVTNVLRHAQATEVVVRVMRRGTHFSLSVSDNGRGFPAEALHSPHAFGVIGMRERAHALNGFLQISREDACTIVSLSAPLRTAELPSPSIAHD